MARYRGPRLKILRRLQKHLPGLTRKSAEERPYPPGQHGMSRRTKVSDFRARLEQKQVLRFNYGVSESQLRRYFRKAHSAKGDTGRNLLALLESRLDNVVFRAGFAPTIPAARQLIRHGHILLNGRRCSIPSVIISQGDKIVVREKSRQIPVVIETIQAPVLTVPEYLSVNKDQFTAEITTMPTRDDSPVDVQESFVVEYYARAA